MTARRLVYLMLTLIALQLSWVAIGAYCTHETGAAARHFGHHAHIESADELAAGDADQPSSLAKKAAPHPHCGTCAHGALSPIELPALVLHLSTAGAPAVGEIPDPDSSIPSPPERPQWRAAA